MTETADDQLPLRDVEVAAACLNCGVVIALRRVYGGSWIATSAKALGVAVIYGTLWSAAVLAVTLWVSR